MYLVQRGQNERKVEKAGKQLKLSGMKKLLSKLCHVEGNRGKKRAKKREQGKISTRIRFQR